MTMPRRNQTENLQPGDKPSALRWIAVNVPWLMRLLRRDAWGRRLGACPRCHRAGPIENSEIVAHTDDGLTASDTTPPERLCR